MADEYIRKQDAVDTINENADSLEQSGVIPYAQGARAMAIVVEQIPPADVVQVVRCRDCKYSHMTYDGKCKYCDIWFPDEDEYMDGDYFCASAEQR